MKFPITLAIASVFGLSTNLVSAQDGSYDIIDLGTFGTLPTTASNATGLNELGHVVGLAEADNGANFAFLYRNGQMINLGFLPNGGSFANAKGVNDLDQVVGQASGMAPLGPGYTGRPFVWNEGHGMSDPSGADTSYGSWCWGINNTGQMAMSLNEAHFYDPVIGLRQIEFPGAPTGFGSTAWEINNDGVVCGAARKGTFVFRAYRYFSATDTIEELHDEAVYQHSEAYGVNDRGDAVGWGVRYDNWKPPMVWTIDGRTIPLPIGDLGPTHSLGQAEHINDKGTVVGLDISGTSGVEPIGWVSYDVLNTATPTKLDLRTVLSAADQLSWDRLHPFEVNENGQICGTGRVNGSTRAFLMTPKVPLASATVRNGSDVNGLCFQNVTLPSLGGTWEARIDATSTPSATLTLVALYTQQGSGMILPTGEILVGGVSLLNRFVAPTAGIANYSLPVPNDPVLAGFTLSSQGAIFNGTTWEACNAIDWVIGDLVTAN